MPVRGRPSLSPCARALFAVGVSMVVATASAPLGGTATAATGSVVVTMSVADTTTTIDAAGCQPGVAGRTDLGTVLPGTTAVTPDDCTVVFGGAGAVASLRISQQDAVAPAMVKPLSGPLDPAFDGDAAAPGFPGNGIVRSDFGTGSDLLRDVAVQADGAAVAVGSSGADVVLARYLRTGLLDTTFNGTGFVRRDLGLATDQLRAVLVQPDQKLVAVGRGSGSDFVLVRFEANGALDTTFDGDAAMPGYPGNGIVRTDVGVDDLGTAHDVARFNDGRLVVVGDADTTAGAGVTRDMAIAVYHPDGRLDTSFNGTGTRLQAFAGAAANDRALGVDVDGSGRIIVGGEAGTDAAAARLLPDGLLDATFDGPTDARGIDYPGNRRWRWDAPGNAGIDGIEWLASGKLVVNAGQSNYSDTVMRLQDSGAGDATFSGDGVAEIVFSDGGPSFVEGEMAVEDSGSILTVGAKDTDLGAGAFNTAGVVRFDPAGALATTSYNAPSGFQTYPVGANQSYAYGAALGGDGSLYVVGEYATTPDAQAVVLRVNSAKIDDYVTGGADDRDWSSAASTSMFGACLRSASGTGAVAGWVTDADCDMPDGTGHWRGVPATASGIASKVAFATTPGSSVTARLAFGVRPATTQAPGSYVAPVTFDVIAPDAP